MAKVRINKRINPEIKLRGEIVIRSTGLAILKGSVGSGKTSVLRYLYRKGVKIGARRYRDYFSYQSLDCYLDKSKSVQENISLVKAVTSIDDEVLDSLISRLQITPILPKKVGNISSGENLRLQLCLALSSNRNAVLLDEPTSLLDKETAVIVKDAICEIALKKFIIIATHALEFDLETNLDLYEIDAGSIKASSPLTEDEVLVAKKPKSKRTLRIWRDDVFSYLSSFVTLALTAFAATNTVFLSEGINPSKINYECLYPQEAENFSFTDPRLDKEITPQEMIPNPSRLEYYIELEKFTIEASTIGRNMTSFLVLPTDDDLMMLSEDLYKLMSKQHGYLSLGSIMIGGVEAKYELATERGYYLYYPTRYLANLCFESPYRYATKNDVITDESLNPIELKEHIVATNKYKYLSLTEKDLRDGSLRYTVGAIAYTEPEKFLVSEDFDLGFTNLVKSEYGTGIPYYYKGLGIKKSEVNEDIIKNARLKYQNLLISLFKEGPLTNLLISLGLILVLNSALFCLTFLKRKENIKLVVFYSRPKTSVFRLGIRFDFIFLPFILLFFTAFFLIKEIAAGVYLSGTFLAISLGMLVFILLAAFIPVLGTIAFLRKRLR